MRTKFLSIWCLGLGLMVGCGQLPLEQQGTKNALLNPGINVCGLRLARNWGSATSLGMNAFAGSMPQLALGSNGDGFAIWFAQTGSTITVYASRFTRPVLNLFGTWSAATPISSFAGVTASPPQIGLDSSGNAIAVWEQVDTASRIYSSRFTPATGWSAAVRLDASTGEVGQPQIALNASGQAVAVWEQLDQNGLAINVHSRVFAPASGWGVIRRVNTQTFLQDALRGRRFA